MLIARAQPVVRMPKAATAQDRGRSVRAAVTNVDGWAEDDHDAGFVSFRKQLKALLRSPASSRVGSRCGPRFTISASKTNDVETIGQAHARVFENNFTPMRISPLVRLTAF